MKKVIKACVVLLILSILLSCGQDGKDGKAFIRFTWISGVNSYVDSNPDTPSSIYSDTYYETDPGDYVYEYYWQDNSGNNWLFEGWYTITINHGEEGGLFTDGEDGEDKHFHLHLSGFSDKYSQSNDIEKQNKEEMNKIVLSADSGIDLSNYQKIHVKDMKTETYYSGNSKMVVTKKMFRLIKK